MDLTDILVPREFFPYCFLSVFISARCNKFNFKPCLHKDFIPGRSTQVDRRANLSQFSSNDMTVLSISIPRAVFNLDYLINEFHFSEVYRSVNYIGSRAK